jgi:hypothetical protein
MRIPGSVAMIGSLAVGSLAATAEAPLFKKLDLATTGIDFVNQGAPQRTNEKGELIFFSTISGKDTAGGVTLGDVDGDGRADIFLTRSQGGNRLYRNLGDFRFADITEQAGVGGEGMWSMGCSFVDIDNDSDLDLYVCGYDTPNRLYINDGKGHFEDRAREFGLDFKGSSVMMAFADYDLDGDLDGYLLTNSLKRFDDGVRVKVTADPKTGQVIIPEELREVVGGFYFPGAGIKTFPTGQADRLFRNEGGRFRDVTAASGITGYEMGLSAVWWDYNQDGRPDLYVANDFYGQDHLYKNNGPAGPAGQITFTDVIGSSMPHTPWYSMGSDTGDLNNDGLPDFMASDMAGSTHYKDKIGMGDMEEEGWFLTYPTPRQYMRNAVYLNSGGERFFEIAHQAGLAATDWTWSILFGDLDNDGWLDVYATNGMTRDLFNSDLKEAEAAIMKRRDWNAAARFWSAREPKKDPNYAFRNRGDLRFTKQGARWGLDHLGVSFGAALGDLDADGDLDLVVNNYGEPASIYRNGASTTTHWLRVRLRGKASNRHGVGATVRVVTAAGRRLMRTLSLSRGYMSAGEPVLHFGLGKETSVDSLTIEWPSGRRQVVDSPGVDQFHSFTEPEAAPAPGEEAADRAMFREQPTFKGAGRIERRFNDFARQPLLPNKLSNLGPGVAWGDVDGDGDDDCYRSQPAGLGGAIYFNDGDHNFHISTPKPFDQHAACEDMAPVFFDADGDGDFDLYVVSGSIECEPGAELLRDRLYLNDGKGGFSIAPKGALPDIRSSGSVAVAVDFDRDGDIDLFVGGRSIPGRYPEFPESHLLRNTGEGRFSAEVMKSGLVTSALWSDVDGDGWLDLLVTHEWGPVKLFRNRAGKLVDATAQAGLAQRVGWWNGIAGGDFDHDGDIDYVVTNFGLNTKYHASFQKPELLYYGDFGGSGKRRLVEAKFEGGVCYPRRGFSCSRNAIPFLHPKLKTFDKFASSPLAELYATRRLASALRLEVNTLESGTLINDGTGRFEFRALPQLAQISPGFGVVVTEVDGDGHPDCVIAQNFFGPQRETGRMDGGLSLVLRGDGAGGFKPVWPRRSGLAVPGDAKSLTVADLNADGWPDLVFGVNNGGLQVFENRGVENGRTFRVRLARAPGARIRVEFKKGPAQTAELYAGGGYLSQSPGTLTFGLAKGAVVEKVSVRWPDGSTTSHEPKGARILNLEAPVRSP